MQESSECPKITGEFVHLLLMDMVRHHALMMTAISATTLAKNQVPMMGVSHDSDIETLLIKAEDSMLEPSNSCGDVSNLICDIFLGTKKAQEFASSKYIVLDDGPSLHKLIHGQDHLLLRFEIDKRIDPDEITFRPDISSVQDFQEMIYRGEVASPSLKKLVVIKDALCRLSIDPLTKRYLVVDITPLASEKETLAAYVQPWQDLKDITLYEFKPEEMYDSETEINLARFANQQLAHYEPVWISTHSFTTFIPIPEDRQAAKPHQYQAYFGKYTLQEWCMKSAPDKLSSLGIDGYINLLESLAKTEGSEPLRKIQCELFALPSYFISISRKFRVKYKMTSIQPEEVFGNICSLRAFIEKSPGDTAELKLQAYKQEARKELSDQLLAEICKLKILHAQHGLQKVNASAADQKDMGIAQRF